MILVSKLGCGLFQKQRNFENQTVGFCSIACQTSGIYFGTASSILVRNLNCCVVKDALNANGFKVAIGIVLEPDASPKHQQMKEVPGG